MKTLQSSSRGHGGRGRGRGGGRGRARDSRFASRFTDPRFQLSERVHAKQKSRRNPQEQILEAARSDPRFSKHIQPEEQEASEEEEESVEVQSGDEEHEDSVGSHQGEDALEGDEEDAQDLDDDVNAWQPEEVEFTEARRRVAIVNCDWDHIRAVDLYAILFHALPLGGQLSDVCVYMSDFGKKMLEHERTHGPDLWLKQGEADVPNESPEANMQSVEELPEESAEDDDEDDNSEPVSDGWKDDDPMMLQEEGEDGEHFASGKYRKYEMDRMKYYYAVATFDSAETAAAVYAELDGMDIEASGVVLDLRYIDDEETFSGPVSRADRIPPNFKPLTFFKAAALTQSRFRISWDQDDVFRHQSVQDSFTGTTAEDDLAAYMAPPDSDSDDGEVDPATGKRTKGSKRDAKLRIRRKYASLLEEIGGLPDDVENSERDDESRGDEASLDSDGDDDSLNRFSDVEVGDRDGSDLEGMEMEATLDLEADSKAAAVQREARLRQKLHEGDLAARAELKYKLRRKEMKKAKKDMAMEEREAERAAALAQRDSQKKQLKEILNTDDDGAVRLSGKERRKRHAKEVKQRLAEERATKKQMRAANQLGVTREAHASKQAEDAAEAVQQLDPRFQSKLLSDPRFHLEVAQRDKRIGDDVAGLAATVAKARRGRRGDLDNSAGESTQKPARNGDAADSAVEYFLNAPAAKKQKRA